MSDTVTAPVDAARPTAGDGPPPGGLSRVGRSAGIMVLGTTLSRVTGLLRLVVLAGLGFDALTDAYTKANNTPNIVYELLLGGILSATLVPVFVDVLSRGRQYAEDALGAVVSMTAVVMVVASLALTLGAPWIVRLYFVGHDDPEQRRLAADLLRFFGPQIAAYGFISIGTALLNARRRFAAPVLAPVLNNLVVIAMLLWAQHVVRDLAGSGASGSEQLAAVRGDSGARLLLGLGTTAGVFAMALALLPSLLRSGVPLRWRWNPRHEAVRSVVRLSGWTLGYVVSNQVALLFVIWVASRNRGDYVTYNSAFATFFQLPHGILAVSIMAALMPELAQAFVERRRGRFRHHLAQGIRTILAVLVPAAVGYVVLARPVVELVLLHGSMTVSSAHRTADALVGFVVGLPAFSVYLLLMNAFQAMRDTRSTFSINVVENAINIVLAALFYPRWGVSGLALAFATAYIVSAFIAGRAVSRRTKGLHGDEIAASLGRIMVASAVMGLAAWVVAELGETLLRGTDPLIALHWRLALLVEVGAAVGAGVTVYLVVGRLVGVTELSWALSGIRRRLTGRRR